MTREDRDNKLNKLLNKKFLDKLSEVAKLYDSKWAHGDYYYVADLINELYEFKKLKAPDLNPYEIDHIAKLHNAK